MLNLNNVQFPPPSNWPEFESLCCDLWRDIWSDPNTQKNGRQGQPQNGVDIYGRPGQGSEWAGVQCKGKDAFAIAPLKVSELLKEVEKAKSFRPLLSEFIVATTGPKDAQIEQVARKITDDHRKEGLFTVHVQGWQDIKDHLRRHQTIACLWYPSLCEPYLPRKALKEIMGALRQSFGAQTAVSSKVDVICRLLILSCDQKHLASPYLNELPTVFPEFANVFRKAQENHDASMSPQGPDPPNSRGAPPKVKAALLSVSCLTTLPSVPT
jgi:hypothetical protein